MDCMRGFHQNAAKPHSMKLLRIICYMGIYEYERILLGIKNAPAHFQRMMYTIFQEEILECWMVVYIDDITIYSETWDQNKVAAVLKKPVPKSIKEMQSFLGSDIYYRNHIKHFSHISSSQYKLSSKYVVFETHKERRDEYERIKHELTNAPVLILPEFGLPFKLCIDAACSQALGVSLHQTQIVDGGQMEGVICYISSQLKDSEARYGATKTECL
ncbi:hypothetical protein O181_001314 [Austropuccinia psidii MF-1]|uniref:Reverse transcriptase/retrotransposon-derived protein RNase H-like domain-containing protein n=1 Tax=Austropuccinia psidii MF-1 TaxID=1389203 RepID=A0A9Q3BA93_9BASI|nr:hypothetical protein [Austropuccinia psidii MF-1]